jgi:hypothetical protein
VIWFVKTKALMFYQCGLYQTQYKRKNALWATCNAAGYLHQLLYKKAARQEQVPSMTELISRACTALVFNSSFYTLAPMLENDASSLPSGSHSNLPDIGHSDLLPLLALNGDTAAMADLLPHTDINHRSEYFGSALYMAAAMGHFEAVTWLLAHGADVNRVGGRWRTPLHASVAHSESTNALSILLDAGANVNFQSSGIGRTPVMTAAAAGNSSAVEILLSHPDLDVNLLDPEKESIVHHLCRVPDAQNMKKLLEKYPDININQCGSEGTPMHAVFNHHYSDFTSDHDELTEILLRRGANLRICEGGTGQAPPSWALAIQGEAEDVEEEVPAAVTRLLKWCAEHGYEVY